MPTAADVARLPANLRNRFERFRAQWGRYPNNATELQLMRPRRSIFRDPKLGTLVGITVATATGGVGTGALTAYGSLRGRQGGRGMNRFDVGDVIAAGAGGFAGGGGWGGAVDAVIGLLGRGSSGSPFPPETLTTQNRCGPGLIRGPMGTCINPPFAGPPGVGFGSPIGGATIGGPPTPAANGMGLPPKGYRLNKSSYWLRDGTFVPKGTRWVKARRRNPLNPRAASNAIRRLESAKKAVARINRISIRKPRKC